MGEAGASIVTVETFRVPPRWIFVRVETDDGLVGWGESIVPKRADAVEGAVRDLARNILGSDPSRIEDIWQRMHRGGFFRGGPVLATAIAGIEQALWDIKGKRYGLPVYEFLGGRVRDRVRAYAWVGGDRPESVVAEVRERLGQGFTAVKMNATAEMHYVDSFAKIEGVTARVAAIRDAFGNDVDVALDFHGRIHRAMAALLIRELAPLHPLWVEEPVLEEHNDVLPALAGLGVPIATGERLYNRWDFKPVLEGRAVDVIQPDVSLTGIFELEKISRMAEAYDVAVAPHCPNGPISLAATLQLDACLPNVFIQEQSTGIHYHAGYAGLHPREMDAYLLDTSELAITDGYLTLPTGPGLGIAVDEEKVRADQQDWHLPDPVWRNPDGTLSEW